jgi:hypothetical protein
MLQREYAGGNWAEVGACLERSASSETHDTWSGSAFSGCSSLDLTSARGYLCRLPRQKPCRRAAAPWVRCASGWCLAGRLQRFEVVERATTEDRAARVPG